MTELEIGNSQFIHAENILKTGLTPDREVGKYERWERRMEDRAELGGQPVTLTGAYLERQKIFSRKEARTMKIEGQEMEVAKEIGLEFATTRGEKRKLVLQALCEKRKTYVPSIYRLALISVEKTKEVGEKPKGKELWGAVVGKIPFARIPAEIDSDRIPVAQEMIRTITGGSTDAWEALGQTMAKSGEAWQEARMEIKPFEKEGLPVKLDDKGEIRIATEVSEATREKMERSMNKAMGSLRRASKALEVPERQMYAAFQEFLTEPGYDDLIRLPRKEKGGQARQARIDRRRRGERVVETVVSAKDAEQDENLRLVREAAQALASNVGLKTGMRVLKLAFPETIGESK